MNNNRTIVLGTEKSIHYYLKSHGRCSYFYSDKPKKFIDSVTYTPFSKTVLGTTASLVYLQRLPTPNVFLRIAECVSGGGVIIIDNTEPQTSFVNEENAEEEVRETKMKRKRESRQETGMPALFYERVLKILRAGRGRGVLFESDLDLSTVPPAAPILKPIAGTLLERCATTDQREVLRRLIDNSLDGCVSVTAPRGRGKSTLLGLYASYLSTKISSITICAVNPESVQSFFTALVDTGSFTVTRSKGQIVSAIGSVDEAVLRGIDDERSCRESDSSDGDSSEASVREYKNTMIRVVFSQPTSISSCDVLLIDEAASIPVHLLRKLISQHKTVLSTTNDGYEGTGKVYTLKLLSELRKNSTLTECTLTTPIRYPPNDPIEQLLFKCFHLDAFYKPKAVAHPSDCQLLCVSPSVLFSGHSVSESLLGNIVAILSGSHYRNSPDDTMRLASHSVFLLARVADDLEIYSVLQVSFEDLGDKIGNLVPNTIKSHYDYELKRGARIVRIAVHSDLRGLGYGTHTVERFISKREKINSIELRSRSTPLLYKEEEYAVGYDWLAASFGCTKSLLNFWAKINFKTVYVRYSVNEATGENTVIVMREPPAQLESLFSRRVVSLLEHRVLDRESTIRILENTVDVGRRLDDEELRRLEGYVQNRVDYTMVIDLMRRVAECSVGVEMSSLQREAIVGVGILKTRVEEIGDVDPVLCALRSGVMKVIAKNRELNRVHAK